MPSADDRIMHENGDLFVLKAGNLYEVCINDGMTSLVCGSSKDLAAAIRTCDKLARHPEAVRRWTKTP